MQQGIGTNDRNGVYVWRIEDFRSKREEVRWRSTPYLLSDPFPVGHKNLQMRIRLYPNGLGEAQGSHVSVQLEFISTSGQDSGELQKIVPLPVRPYYHRRTVALLDQSDRVHRKDLVWSEEPTVKATWPLHCMMHPHGPLKLVSISKLEKEDVYLRDDVMCLRVTIEPREDLMNIYFAEDGKLKPLKKGSLDKPIYEELSYTDC